MHSVACFSVPRNAVPDHVCASAIYMSEAQPAASVPDLQSVAMQVQPAMARELFPAGFVSCWAELDADGQDVRPVTWMLLLTRV